MRASGRSSSEGDRGDHSLRAIAAGHRQRVGALRNGGSHELLECVPEESVFDRLDPSRPRLVGELEPLRLTAADSGLKNSTGWAGGEASASGMWTAKAALVAIKVANAVAPTTITSKTPPSRITISSSVATSRAAANPRPATRRAPRRISPYQPTIAAPIRSTAMIRPRGKLAITE